MRRVLLPLLVLLTLLAVYADEEPPKADGKAIGLVNRKAEFDAMLSRIEPIVAERTPEAEERLVTEFGKTGIEVLVRFREGHLVPVFDRLAAHEDWYVRRLAVLGLQRNFGVSRLDTVIGLLDDGNPCVREIAASTTAILHWAGKKERALIPREERKALKELGKRRKADAKALAAAMEKEVNPYVKATLAAAIETFERRKLLRIHTEQIVGVPPARHVPRCVGAEVNSYQKGSGFAGGGSGKLRPTRGWAYPVLLYPREILTIGSDRPLVPLPAKALSLHFGHDCGWFLEGSSIYAIADGVVRLVRSGGDWGGLIVCEYMAEDKSKVCGLNGHCGMWVFAAPGESVKAGQMIGTMALSFSPENGGHGAHDHFGMWEGAFAEGMCYGRSGAGKSLEGWLVPADYLTPKVDGKTRTPESYR